MKKVILFMLHGLVINLSFAQTNIFPNSGPVGIGITNPSHQVQLYSETDDNQFVIENGNSTGYTNFWVKSTGHTYQIGTAGHNESVFGVASKFFVFDRDNLAMRFVINPAGKVGIGTTNPQAQLEIAGDLRLGNNVWHTSSDGHLRLYYGTNSTTYFGSLAGYVFRDANDQDMVRIEGTGKVIIGSSTNLNTGNHMLAVNGSILTKKIVVKSTENWPDYVFKQHYDLPSLKSVEAFIKRNNHLPGIPSSEEVEKNDLDLGGTQALLLQKIEELTLYLIEQNKRIAEQEKKISHQQAKINQLMREKH